MWQRVEAADIDRARESLGYRLAETLRRHEEEINSMRTKHADEIRLLETKQVELATLDALIDRLVNDFESLAVAIPEPIEDQEPSAEVARKNGADAHEALLEIDTSGATEGSPSEALAVRYASANFFGFRKAAS